MHIVFNRVHPETGKAHDMWKSKERLERGTHEIAREMNFLEVAGKHNELVWDGSLGKETETREQRMMREDLKPWDKAKVKSVKQDVSEFFFTADSWQTLGKNLNSKGLWLHKKGQGLIVTDGDGFTQLSKMGKKIRLKEMEQRFGEKWTDYEASQHKEFEALVAAESKTIANELQQEQSRDDAPLPDERFIEFQQIDHKLQDFERAQKVQKSAAMVLRTKGDIKRAEYLLGRAKELLTYHEDQFNQLLTKVYKDPEQAKERVAEVSKVGLLKETIWKGGKKRERWKRILEFLKLRKKHEIAKKRGKRIDKHKTRARRQAERLEYHVFYRLQKIRAAQGRLRNREDQLTQAKFNLVHREKDHEKEKITESYLLSLRKEALVKVPEKEILKSYDLTRREKAQLLAARNFALKEVEQDKGEDKDKGRDFER